ncbi:MAG: hypothetical protein AB7D27_14695 [Desulfomicrobium sp.]
MARAKGIPEKFTADKRSVFLAALAKHGFVARAAAEAGVHRSTVLRAKDADKAFSKAWEEAKDEYTERLEQEADRRAYKGMSKPIFYKGKKCGVIREFSDTLLIFRLKALKPEVYKDRSETNHTGNVTVEIVRFGQGQDSK